MNGKGGIQVRGGETESSVQERDSIFVPNLCPMPGERGNFVTKCGFVRGKEAGASPNFLFCYLHRMHEVSTYLRNIPYVVCIHYNTDVLHTVWVWDPVPFSLAYLAPTVPEKRDAQLPKRLPPPGWVHSWRLLLVKFVICLPTLDRSGLEEPTGRSKL